MSSKTKLLAAKVTAEEHARVHAAARASGTSVQAYILKCARRLVARMEKQMDDAA